MYNNQFVATIKVAGKVLRENRDAVQLPFSEEYVIHLKNLSNRRAVVNVEIDGHDVLNGHGLVIDANTSLDLERFVGDSMYEGRKFKFIERTAAVEQHRGIGAEDGIIRISFRYEQQFTIRPAGSILRSSYVAQNSFYGNVQSQGVSCASPSISATSLDQSVSAMCYAGAQVNDAGITVEGSKSEQQFHSASVGTLEAQEHVIIFKLFGGSVETPVVKPITVKTKKKCNSCGKEYKSSMEYCPGDGTYLRAA